MKNRSAAQSTSAFAGSERATWPFAVHPFAPPGWLDLVADGTAFVAERLRQETKSLNELMGCRTPMDVFEVQAEFIRTASVQYAEGMSQAFVRIGALTPFGAAGAHSRGYNDVPV